MRKEAKDKLTRRAVSRRKSAPNSYGMLARELYAVKHNAANGGLEGLNGR